MGKKLYIAIISIITIACVMVGLIVNIGLFKGFPFSRHMSIYDEKAENISSDEILEPFTNIQLDISMGDVEIKTGDNYSINYSYPKYLKIQVANEEGTLKVTDKSVGFSFGKLNVEGGKVEITVPSDAKLELIKTNCDMGNVEIYDIKADVFKADLDMGDYELHSITAGDLEVNCDMGDIEVSGTVDEISAYCDLGNVEVNLDNYDDASMKLGTDLGNVDVNGKSQGNSFNK